MDQEREYSLNAQKQYYTQRGIQVETTVAHITQQSGIAEWFSRTVVEKIHAMLFDSKLPKFL